MRKIIGFVLLAGIAFGLFVVVTIPFEMVKKAEAEGWPSRKGVITHSYVSQQRGSTGAPYSKVEICGKYKDTGERFCVGASGTAAFGGEAARQAPSKRSLGIRWAARSTSTTRPMTPERRCSRRARLGRRCSCCSGLDSGSSCSPCSCGCFERESNRVDTVARDRAVAGRRAQRDGYIDRLDLPQSWRTKCSN